MADQLFIHLVVHDASAVEGLALAAHELRKRTLRTRDVRVARFGAAAERCILAVAAAYTQLQSVSLERPLELVQMLPDLCADLCACLEAAQPAGEKSGIAWCEDWFPALAALSADGALGELVKQPSNADQSDAECAVRFSLIPNAARQWVVSTEAEPRAKGAGFTRYVRAAASSIEQWVVGCLHAFARMAPTA